MIDTTVRRYTAEDRDSLFELFARVGETPPTEALWGHVESQADIYLVPYIELEPESLFVATHEGRLVGYLAGCVDSAQIPRSEELLERAIEKYDLTRRPESRAFFRRRRRDIFGAKLRRKPVAKQLQDERWPSHLRLNVEPDVRGKGVADQLMEAWIERLLDVGSRGCYIQTTAENARGVRFLARMGFLPHGDTPIVAGVRRQGHRVHQLTAVWSPTADV